MASSPDEVFLPMTWKGEPESESFIGSCESTILAGGDV